MSGLHLLIPEATLSVVALVALFAERLPGRGRTAAALGSAAAAAAAVIGAVLGTHGAYMGGTLVLDATAVFARTACAGLTSVFLLWLAGRGMGGERRQEAVALALLAAVGAMLAASAADLVSLFISIELATMPAYVLVGYRRDDAEGLEGTAKYFLLSLMTSVVMLYGFSFVYGLSGSTRLADISLSSGGPLLPLAVMLVFVGLAAKLSAAPFHYWAPDAYAGAPAASVAFVSTVPKVAGVVALVRIAGTAVSVAPQAGAVVAAVALASMLLGNLAAFPQTDIRRLMAYSGVAHAGYILLGLAAFTPLGSAAAVLYALAYSVPSMAVMLVAAEEGVSLGDLAGLGARRPWVAWSLVVWLVSLVGIPPLVGFFGKLYLFGAVLSGHAAFAPALVVAAVLMSVVSAGYYFRVVHAAFFAEAAGAPSPLPRSRAADAALLLLVAATLALGVGVSRLLVLLGLT